MFGTHDLLLFLGAAITLSLMPGPDSLYIVSRSVAHGRRAGVWSVAGVSAGVMVHISAAAFGLSAILASSATAFAAVKLAGAGYLVFLGAQLLFEHAKGGVEDAPASIPKRATSWAVFRQGMLTNLLNPKVALFFLAFLPQFVDPAAVSTPWPFFFLGGIFVSLGAIWCLVLALSAAWIASRLRATERTTRLMRRLAGGLFIGLGLRLAVQQAE